MKGGFLWVVPKSPTFSGYKIMNCLFKRTLWLALFIIFLITVIVMWFAAKCIPNETKLISFQKYFLTVLMFSFDCRSNIPLNNRTPRVLVIFYLVYSMQVSTLFHGKLINALTEPGHEPAITTVEEFADLCLCLCFAHWCSRIGSMKEHTVNSKYFTKQFINPTLRNATNLLGFVYLL